MDHVFDRDGTAIQLWANPSQPADWGYPRHRDTRSLGYWIEGNSFVGTRVAVRLDQTSGVRLAGNAFLKVDTLLAASRDTSDVRADRPRVAAPLATDRPWRPNLRDRDAPRPLPGGRDPWLADTAPRGRHTILIDAWGPWDRLSPKLWPARRADSAYTGGPLALAVLGPPGEWRAVSARGIAALSDSVGSVGDTIVVIPEPARVTDWQLTLEYVGGAVTTSDGRIVAARQPYRFSYDRLVAPVQWAVRVVAWDSVSDPRTRLEAFRARLVTAPLVTRRDAVLDYLWSRPRLPGFPVERFAVLAEGVVDLPEGAGSTS